MVGFQFSVFSFQCSVFSFQFSVFYFLVQIQTTAAMTTQANKRQMATSINPIEPSSLII